jgi:hypothetical protein
VTDVAGGKRLKNIKEVFVVSKLILSRKDMIGRIVNPLISTGVNKRRDKAEVSLLMVFTGNFCRLSGETGIWSMSFSKLF